MADFAPKPARVNGNLAAAQALTTATTGSGAVFANTWAATTTLILIEVLAHNHLVTFDGTTPSATNGHTLYTGQPLHWNVATAQAAKFLALTGAGTVMGSQFMVAPGATQLPDTSICKEIPI